MSDTDETLHFAAVKALITSPTVYEYGTVPGLLNPVTGANNTGTLPSRFALLTVERRYVPPLADRVGRTDRTGWRISVRVAGSTPLEVRTALKNVTAALDGVRVTVGDQVSTPIKHETSTAMDPADKRYTALTQWTYAL